MYELKFDERQCLSCATQDCLTKCQYMNIDRDTAKREILKIAHGEDSFVLHDCVTCYACEEYCPVNNHPFYLIVEQQEKLNIPPLPQPIIRRGINTGVPFRGEPEIVNINGRALNMGVFSDLLHLIQGKLFTGLPLISNEPGIDEFFYIDSGYLDDPTDPNVMKTVGAFDGKTVTLDVSGFKANQDAYLLFNLYTEDEGLVTTIELDNVNISLIPAPGALVLGGIGLGCVTWLRRRRTL